MVGCSKKVNGTLKARVKIQSDLDIVYKRKKMMFDKTGEGRQELV